MKYLFTIITAFVLSSCGEQSSSITVKNENPFGVSNKLVSVAREAMPDIADKLPVIKISEKQFVPSQLVDADLDGEWDEMIFQVSLDAGQEIVFELLWVEENDFPVFEKQTQVYLGYSENRDGNYISLDQQERDGARPSEETPYAYQFEGPGWENNVVAYRIYFDTRNGKDIFGKITQDLVAQQIATGENYHQLQDWGMDVLKVGKSLGAGSLALLKKDSLIRLGATSTAEFSKVENGPVLSSFKLTYKGWDIFGESYDLEETISIYANKRWYKSEISLARLGSSVSDTLVAGIVNLKDASVASFQHQGMHGLFTYGRQSENNDMLGMAILVSDDMHGGTGKAPLSGEGITNSELVYLKPNSDKYVYYFYSGWELENDTFSSIEGYQSELKQAMDELSINLLISVK